MLKHRSRALRHRPAQAGRPRRRHLVEVEDRPAQRRLRARSTRRPATAGAPASTPTTPSRSGAARRATPPRRRRRSRRSPARSRRPRRRCSWSPSPRPTRASPTRSSGASTRSSAAPRSRSSARCAASGRRMVFELGFEGINRSGRHKSGIAVRFPRMLRIRDDKPLHEADTLAVARGPAGAAARRPLRLALRSRRAAPDRHATRHPARRSVDPPCDAQEPRLSRAVRRFTPPPRRQPLGARRRRSTRLRARAASFSAPRPRSVQRLGRAQRCRPALPFQLRSVTSLRLRISAASPSSSDTNASIAAAIATSAARALLPSSTLIATPRPRSGKAAQNTPSAPTLQKTRSPRRSITRVSKRPVPPTMNGCAGHRARAAAGRRAHGRGRRPTPVPTRAKACARWRSGIA